MLDYWLLKISDVGLLITKDFWCWIIDYSRFLMLDYWLLKISDVGLLITKDFW